MKIEPTRRGWALLAAVAVVIAGTAVDAVASIGRLESGVRVGSLDLGGKRLGEAERLLTDRAKLLSTEPAQYTEADETLTADPEDVGFFPDVDATLEAARRVGRDGHVFRRAWQRLRAYFATTEVGWTSSVDRESADGVISAWAERFDTPGNEAGIEAREDRIVAVEPKPGRILDRPSAHRALVRGLETWPRSPIALPFKVEPRRTDAEDAAQAVRAANSMIQAPIRLTTPSGSLELQPSDLAPLLTAEPVRRGREWRLEVLFSPEKVTSDLGPRMEQFETDPVNASFAVSGSRVSVREGRDGLKFDGAKTAEALTDVARDEAPRTAEAAFTSEPPNLTTETAEAMNITELVSTFTTRHPCCQPRVTNIHKMAAKVDGMIVRPGHTFSLNQRVGRRTTDKGYVSAPMIFDGEFKDDVGGGVSQFATTMYNAIFFGGYRIDSAKAHSYYISRYPPGREATISWPAPDLKFTNNSSAGILIKTSYSNTSITVSFYGDKGGKSVRAEAGERTNFKDPPEKREANSSMRPGAERVKQGGSRGFDIVVFRIIEQGGETKRERIFTRYKPEPRIIEYGPGTPVPATPAPAPDPTPAPTPPPSSPPPTGAPQATPAPQQ